MADITREQLIEHLSKMTVLDLVGLTKALEDSWGVKAAPVAVAAGPAGGGAAAAVVEEKTEFNVELTTVGEKKIQVIKVVREITGLGLKEAKDLVDGAPRAVKEAIPKAEAEDIKKKLEAEGATVTIK